MARRNSAIQKHKQSISRELPCREKLKRGTDITAIANDLVYLYKVCVIF